MAEDREAAEKSQADLEELAGYFDRTDAGDFPWGEATDVVIERRELEQISLRLPKNDLAALRQRAAQAGVGYTTLIRMIVRQYLSSGQGRQAAREGSNERGSTSPARKVIAVVIDESGILSAAEAE
jgi:hypothetical protein